MEHKAATSSVPSRSKGLMAFQIFQHDEAVAEQACPYAKLRALPGTQQLKISALPNLVQIAIKAAVRPKYGPCKHIGNESWKRRLENHRKCKFSSHHHVCSGE